MAVLSSHVRITNFDGDKSEATKGWKRLETTGKVPDRVSRVSRVREYKKKVLTSLLAKGIPPARPSLAL